MLSTIPPTTTLPQGIHVSVVNAIRYKNPSKNRDTSEWETILSELNQEPPDRKDWSNFLSNEKNKHQLVNVLVHFVPETDITEKTVFVNKGNQSYYKHMNENLVIFQDLCLSHKEIDQKIRMHAVYVSQLNKKPICVVADDTGAFILLVCSLPFDNTVFFCHGKNSDTEGISYQQNFTELQ